MIIDGLLRVSDGQALTTQGTVASTNVIDLAHARDIGVGDSDLEWNVSVSTAFTSGGAGTLQVLAQGSVDNSAWTTYSSSPTFALATLTAGRQIVVKMPRRAPGAARPRYIRLAYVVGTADFTGGAVKADLVHGAPASIPAESYPAGIYPSV